VKSRSQLGETEKSREEKGRRGLGGLGKAQVEGSWCEAVRQVSRKGVGGTGGEGRPRLKGETCSGETWLVSYQLGDLGHTFSPL
jgi:hypothetical protein